MGKSDRASRLQVRRPHTIGSLDWLIKQVRDVGKHGKLSFDVFRWLWVIQAGCCCVALAHKMKNAFVFEIFGGADRARLSMICHFQNIYRVS